MRYSLCVAAAVAAAACAALGACGDDDSPSGSKSTGTSASSQAEPAKIAYVTFAYESFVQAEEKGLIDAVKPGGGSVTVLNSNFDPPKQITDCKDAINSGRYNVIVLEPVASETVGPCVDAAKAAGIPLIGLTVPPVKDQLEPVDGVAGQVVITRDNNAKKYAETAQAACEGLHPCKAIVEIPFPGDQNSAVAIKAAQAAIPDLEILAKVVGQFDPAVISKNLPDALAAHPDAQVFLAFADSTAVASIPIVAGAGLADKIKIVGSGGSQDGIDAIKAGTMMLTAMNWPRSGAKLAGEMAIKAVNGEPIEPKAIDAITILSPSIATKDNVSEITAEW